MKKIVIVTDAWHPQVNGVVRVTEAIERILKARGYSVLIIHSGLFMSLPVPFYREITLALFPNNKVKRLIEDFAPDAVHLMTEGPLGWAARAFCLRRGVPFTSWYHTHFDFYIDMRIPGLKRLVTARLRRFHNRAERTFVSTTSLQSDLVREGFTKTAVVPLGVDTAFFVRNLAPAVPQLQKPVYVFFSRLAVEKSPEEFLKLPLDGTKLVIGDGPDRAKLERKYKGQAVFVGYRKRQELVDYLSIADAMVFPSRTETFGLAALEALSCGVPVAAHNVLGPKDIITEGKDGYLSDDLATAAQKCLTLNREDCRAKALEFSWDKSVDAFLKNLVLIEK
ncbi:MAG TPA: glycosyltransferase family 1 protein [Candidatus Paceibacterota bacterium]|nr:glycosyltransferase family 1 protein [Candidatus Paceibacterota bacterium]